MTYQIPKVFSMSHINTYRDCPRQYFLAYVAKIETPMSPYAEYGIRIHKLIADKVFTSDDPKEQKALSRAEEFLKSLPEGVILETNREMLFGEIFGRKAVGIPDFYWTSIPLMGDWKSGSFYEAYTDSHEVQAYIYNELYKQKFGRPLEAFYFKFLKDDGFYKARCITQQNKRQQIEKIIQEVLTNIDEGRFGRKFSSSCKWCDYKEHCKMDESLLKWCKD